MCYMYHVCVIGLIFTESYARKKVPGRTGHSLTFVWKFSGGVKFVTWGLANDAGSDKADKLISLNALDVDDLLPKPEAYRGRVNGTRTGDSSSGQASFTLYNVSKDDEGFYFCLLEPSNPNSQETTDFVQLVVVGMYLFRQLKIRALERDLTNCN